MLSAFLADLRKRDVRVWADGDRLRCRAPAGVLTPELRQALQERKREILEFLRSGAALADQPRAIVPLQPRGTRTPVFGVGGHNGDVFCYRALARQLGDDQPFFGLQPPGLDGHSEPLTRVEDLAAYFADQVRAFRPEGPYVVVGFCAGGGIAFELARQLVQDGADVELVALFGSPFPTWYRFFGGLRWRLARQLERLSRHARILALHPWSDLRAYVGERLAGRRANRGAAATAKRDAVLVRRAKLERVTLAALRRYSPAKFAGTLRVFLPSRAWLGFGTPARGWRSVTQSVEEYVGPDGCTGDDMLREHAPWFAEQFRRCRDAGTAASASAPTTAPTRAPLLAASLTH
jgi:thioesterase domain-containing protein